MTPLPAPLCAALRCTALHCAALRLVPGTGGGAPSRPGRDGRPAARIRPPTHPPTRAHISAGTQTAIGPLAAAAGDAYRVVRARASVRVPHYDLGPST